MTSKPRYDRLRIVLIAGTLGAVAIGGWLARDIAARRRVLQHQLATQAWHLRKLLPSG